MKLVWTVVMIGGCARAEDITSATLPIAGVTGVSVDLERGDARLDGSVPTEFDVVATSWGHGLTRGAAKKQSATNKVTFAVRDQLVALVGRSDRPTAGVDFELSGPAALSVDAILLHGDLDLTDLRGDLVATADAITGQGLSGALDLTATAGGVDLEASPVPGDSIRIDARGNTVLRLPYGGDYKLQVFPDPDFPGTITDLGFADLSVAPDYVSGRAGSGSIALEIAVRGGRFDLRTSNDSGADSTE